MHHALQLWSARAGTLVVASALALACAESSAPRIAPSVAALSVAGGSGQEAEVGSALRDAVAVLARDSDGNAVGGATIRFSATAAGSAVTPATAQTGRDGIARVRWTLGSEAGTQSLVAAAERPGEDVTTTVTATARPGDVASLRADVSAGPVAVTVGDTTLIVFRGVDRFGNASARLPAGGARFAWTVDRAGVVDVVATEEISAADPPYLRARVVGRGVGGAVLEAAVTGLVAAPLHFRFDVRAYAGPGRDLAFSSFAGPQRLAPPHIYVLSADGTRLTDLGDGSYPAWSPDGGEIAFVGPPGGLSVMNADGSGRRALTTGLDARWAPAWSPDGRRIAFVSGDGNWPVVRVMNRDGTGVRTIDADPCGGICWGTPLHLEWSPDGALIAYSAGPPVGQNEVDNAIILANADGSGTRRLALADGTAIFGVGPAWSPDGRLLAFMLARSVTSLPGTPPGRAEIVVVGLDGTGLRRITRRESEDWDVTPAWSADGRIAFVRVRSSSGPSTGLYGIYVVNADGTELRRVSGRFSTAGHPAWRPTR